MDHFVLDLATPDIKIAYFTVYSLGHMAEMGSGRVALLSATTNVGLVDVCFAETLELGERMQARLRALRQDGGRAPEVGVSSTPVLGSFSLTPSEEGEFTWTVDSTAHRVEATWRSGHEPFFVSAPMGSFHPSRDYVATMISFGQADLRIDDDAVDGHPYPHAWFEEVLGRTFSSCHVALAETAVEAT
ncbi:MAG TPA: hypothetical protein VMM81_03430 [Acidimicrobiia bacterium]|nr:hypothetical protein [Acidimicrobiia bacterium]